MTESGQTAKPRTEHGNVTSHTCSGVRAATDGSQHPPDIYISMRSAYMDCVSGCGMERVNGWMMVEQSPSYLYHMLVIYSFGYRCESNERF